MIYILLKIELFKLSLENITNIVSRESAARKTQEQENVEMCETEAPGHFIKKIDLTLSQ